MNNPFTFIQTSKRPLDQGHHSKSYLMGIRLPSGHLIPAGALKRNTLTHICSQARIRLGTGSRQELLHRAIICHSLGTTLNAHQKFNRDAVRPLEG